MPHFHIPLQSGSDAVLKLMNRRYDTALFSNRIAQIRRMIPDAFIGVDVIAGARGETPDEWARSLEFIGSLDVTRLHVFPYSERPGTAALMMSAPEVAPSERHQRAGQLQRLSDAKLQSYFESMVGAERPVLWEYVLHPYEQDAEAEGSGETDAATSTSRGGEALMSGLTDNYLRVVAPARPELLNTVSLVRIEGIDSGRDETLLASHL